MDVVKKITRITSKVSIKEREITKILKQRRPIEEEIGVVQLPTRHSETLKRGYLKILLCS